MREKERRIPGDYTPPVMAHKIEFLFAQSVRQPDDIRCQFQQIIGIDSLGSAAEPIATLIRYCHPEAGRLERLYLMSPEKPASGKTVQQHHQRTLTFHQGSEGDAIGFDEFLIPVASVEHWVSPAIDCVPLGSDTPGNRSFQVIQ